MVVPTDGKGLGFYYAQENSQAAAYNAVDIINDPVDRARDGDLRTFRGFYGQLALVFGPVMVAGGAGASQLIPLDWEKGPDGPALPKQNFGINGVFNYHIADNLILTSTTSARSGAGTRPPSSRR